MAVEKEPQSSRPSGTRERSDAFLEWRTPVRGSHPGDQFVRVARHRGFRQAAPGILVPRRGTGEPTSGFGRVLVRMRRLIFGSPIATAHEAGERVGRIKGLAIFGSNNISSSAYATEETCASCSWPARWPWA